MTRDKLTQLEKEFYEMGQKVADARRSIAPESVTDYMFRTPEGEVALSQLFGEHDDLIVVHNMGRGCKYCTLWADGFTGLHDHILSRAGFVISSPDAPEVQKEFADSRGWPYRMVSAQDGPFTKEMGFEMNEGEYWPGVSTFHRGEGGSIVRTGHTHFGPGDQFCGVWHFFDLLGSAHGDWTPNYKY